MAVDTVLPKVENGRELLQEADRQRIAHPIACIEQCATATEMDFLWRYFEASDFSAGHVRVFDDEGQPIGRYASYADKIDAQSYIRFECAARDWVRRFSLGREWGVIATLFERMMRGESQIGFIDWGTHLTDSDDQKVAYGGAQVSMRMLGLRLKDGYRDFFRWYEATANADASGKKASPREVMRQLEREGHYQNWIEEFKQKRGVPI